ncbi:MAG TPA: hypothetical protein VJ936_08500 [Desulfobacteraceae bacterium]|nr:hypothetical protein [Desulfobacteraceae bacterium]
MDYYLDKVWWGIHRFLQQAVAFLDHLFSPLEVFGPGFVIFLLAFLTVGLTRITTRFYVTGRYTRLKNEFEHWKRIREEAGQLPDREKGKRLARNIDQAELNRVYYDFFFEGLLKNFITNVLPILLVAAHVTTVYTPEILLDRFGKEWVFSFSLGGLVSVNISSLFWYIISLLVSFVVFALLKRGLLKKDAEKECDQPGAVL